ncbi:MAG: sulfotransferase [Phycisphaerales bacterium]|nr:sulfotransferase [Phycisphaerales bacterium]
MTQVGTGFGGTARGEIIHRCSALLDAGQYKVAIALLRETLAKNPTDPAVLHMLGFALSSTDGARESLRHLKFAAQLQPHNPDIYCGLAEAHRKLNQVRDAHQALDKALKINPSFGRAISFKALLYQSSGNAAMGLELIKAHMDADQDAMFSVLYGQLARQLKRNSEGIDVVTKALERPEIPRTRREELNFALGHLYDAEGEYDKAFECFQRGNTMAGEQPPDDFDAHLAKYTKDIIEGMPTAEVDASRAVLIVGMPRSGTTLTEQIIASHPKAGGVGESPVINEIVHAQPTDGLTQPVINAHAQRYLGMLRDAFAEEKTTRVCDKMPENYIYLGTVSRLLPGAHYIHCVRDARDTCLSIYFQRFGPNLQYARGLETCARQYLGYLKTMDHWRDVLDISILDSRYEELTADPEPHVRELLEHIGLEFDSACMEHHKNKQSVHTASIGQVRQPIYKSSRERWRNYEKHIGPMLEILEGV